MGRPKKILPGSVASYPPNVKEAISRTDKEVFDAVKENPTGFRKKGAIAVIIYRPQDFGDPNETTFSGIRFKANEPVEVPYASTVLQMHVVPVETKDGIFTRGVEKHVPVPDVLRTNPWFEVDGVKAERVKPGSKLPETPDEYRGYAIDWISKSLSAKSMDQRWATEEGLRQRCGVAPGDLVSIRSLFEARHGECADLDKTRAA